MMNSVTLECYANQVEGPTNFSFRLIEELKTMASNLEGRRFVCLSFDEIKIESELVFNK